MTLIYSVLLFALACNLDTLVLAMGFGAKGTRPTPGGCFTLAAVTTLITCLALLLGRAGGGLLPAVMAARGGGLVLVGIGLWMLLDWLKAPGEPAEAEAPSLEYVSLAAALAFNNAGAGLAAGMGGMSPLWGGAANFVVTLLFLPLGLLLGQRLRGGRLARLAVPLSGALLVLLGGVAVFS